MVTRFLGSDDPPNRLTLAGADAFPSNRSSLRSASLEVWARGNRSRARKGSVLRWQHTVTACEEVELSATISAVLPVGAAWAAGRASGMHGWEVEP
jgi:hypothetical protein